MNKDAKLSQSDLEALQSRTETIASRWYDGIAPAIPDLNAAEAKSQLLDLTKQAINLLSTDSIERRSAQAIGQALVRDVSTHALVLGKTQEVLARQFTHGLGVEQISALLPHLIGLLSEIATGFIQERDKQVEVMRRKFLSTTSHDMRSPLNAIIGFSRIIMKGVDGPVTDVQMQDLGTINSSGKALLGMIDDIFNIEKIEAGSIGLDAKSFGLASVIDSAIDTVQPLIDEYDNTLVVHVEPPGGMRSDPAKVKQVLVNLLSHAAKFTRQGTITLEVSRTTIDGSDRVQFQISDTGLGMTPAQIERFAAASDTSTLQYDDIPLMVSQRLCQLMGGEFAIESKVGTGTTFTVELPARLPGT